MDLRLTDKEEVFRKEVRDWLAEAVPSMPPKPDRYDWHARREYDTTWQRMLYDAGYAGISWPVENGGRGATPSEELIFHQEAERARAPYVGVNFVGLLHAGPTIGVEASPEQRAEHLPRILKGEEIWCQGFSEPGAGSDLASLRTRAVRDGDEYVISGQKIWTSHAQVADWCEMIVRTDPSAPKHKGITWLMVRMDSPGIDVRPMKTLVGTEEFSEVFLDDVRVPVANRVGNENDGWRVAMVTFSFERGTAFVSELLESFEILNDVSALAQKVGRDNDVAVQRRIGHLRAELDALWALCRRNVSQAARSGVPGIGGSVFKLGFSETRQKLVDLAAELIGRDALHMGELVEFRLRSLSLTIAAGTSQIQRNIIAERVLGMPKEPQWTSS
jgi:alkylation response protein AidB-like acyl-CoA dehydrogenase